MEHQIQDSRVQLIISGQSEAAAHAPKFSKLANEVGLGGTVQFGLNPIQMMLYCSSRKVQLGRDL